MQKNKIRLAVDFIGIVSITLKSNKQHKLAQERRRALRASASIRETKKAVTTFHYNKFKGGIYSYVTSGPRREREREVSE